VSEEELFETRVRGKGEGGQIRSGALERKKKYSLMKALKEGGGGGWEEKPFAV